LQLQIRQIQEDGKKTNSDLLLIQNQMKNEISPTIANIWTHMSLVESSNRSSPSRKRSRDDTLMNNVDDDSIAIAATELSLLSNNAIVSTSTDEQRKKQPRMLKFSSNQYIVTSASSIIDEVVSKLMENEWIGKPSSSASRQDASDIRKALDLLKRSLTKEETDCIYGQPSREDHVAWIAWKETKDKAYESFMRRTKAQFTSVCKYSTKDFTFHVYLKGLSKLKKLQPQSLPTTLFSMA
jgi:hypothetical protein